MSKEKNAKTCRKALSSKGIALMMALVLMVGGVIGGTVAWLTATSDTVTNTFTTSDISVTLTETTGSEYKMVPGWTITKDPKATVVANSEDCFLFVKIDKSANYDTYLNSYTVATGWTKLENVDGVYYKVFDSKDTTNTNTKGTAYSILKDDQVTVKDTVTKADFEKLTKATNPDPEPTLTFTAYATQLYKDNNTRFTAAEAWANIN